MKTLYAHMKDGSLRVSAGQRVTAGSALGIMGMTGDSTAIHLHFEVRVNDNPTNPIPYIHMP